MSALRHYFDLEQARKESKEVKISKSDFDKWYKKRLSFDLLKGYSPGQSFCQHFEIIDFILAMHRYNLKFDYLAYIRKTYIQ